MTCQGRSRASLNAAAAAALFVLVCIAPGNAAESYGAPPPHLAASLDRLVRAYPDWFAGHDGEFLILKNGRKFPISDHRTNKTFDELIESPDIDDMFYAAYPVGTRPRQPAKNDDPGRVRFGPLFAAIYGDCKKNEVAKKLRTIQWMPQHGGGRVVITTANGVDKALEAVSRELDRLPGNLAKAAYPSAGTYNCRTVAGSGVTSMHAYGAAIDLNTRYSDYWRWAAKGGAGPVWKNRMPVEIVPLFEKHGFIWGGYWYHFDTMHFEYRPELLPESLPSSPQ